MAFSSSSCYTAPPPLPDDEDPKVEVRKQIRNHEIAIFELNDLKPSKAIYQKTGSIFFKRNVKAAITNEQKLLDVAKCRLQNMDAAT